MLQTGADDKKHSIGAGRKKDSHTRGKKLSALSPRAIKALVVTMKAPTRRRFPANTETKDKK